MSDLVVIVYETEAKAEEMRKKVFDLQKEYLIELGDAAIAVKQPDGNVKLNQLLNTTAAGAASGGLWGLLIGMIFLNPLLGVALGAASGALSGALVRLRRQRQIYEGFVRFAEARQRGIVPAHQKGDGR